MKNIRVNEYLVFIYRIFLVYLFYAIARGLFLYFNADAIGDYDVFTIFYYGLAFDNCAIMYVNLLFILLSLLPLVKNTTEKHQKIVFWSYFLPNSIAYSTNFIDMIYYPFSKSRLTTASFAVIENEQNKMTLFLTFLGMYWYVFVLFFVLIALWGWLYKKITVKTFVIENKKAYFSWSALFFIGFGTLIMMAIRGGGFSTDVRPINMLDANRHVTITSHADAILNTPFCLIRSIGKNKGFREYKFVDEKYISDHIKPIKQYKRIRENKANIVIFILESFGREYWGCMNKNRQHLLPNYQSYTPFLDSLAQHSAVFDNAFCTGRQSIHGMSSILAGIPSFQVAYTSSPYVKQPTESVVSIAKNMGYDTSFFHSAPNGSMGFWGFSNILGFDHYYGKTEYNNDADDDGHWGIWDEPFFQYMCRTLSQKKTPFLGTIFTLSSHHPFQIPKKYEGKFNEGTLQIHKTIGYTDYSLKKFFESAKKESWYQNTIFVFVNDHGNQTYYDFYKQPISNTAAAMMFFSPNPELVTPTISSEIVQQIDIYPSLVDLMGYDKPFRSWGRSLFSEKEDEPARAFISNAHNYQLMQGNYIYIMDEKGKLIGLYKKEDEALKINLLDKEQTPEISKGSKDLQAFIQDYMDRIINQKLK